MNKEITQLKSFLESIRRLSPGLVNAIVEGVDVIFENTESMDSPEELTIGTESHVHSDIMPNIEWIKEQVSDVPNGFSIMTLRGAPHPVKSGLYGPSMGDAPIGEDEVLYDKRPGREWESRLIADPSVRMRPTDIVTVIFGPHDGKQKYLYTVYGGAEAPQEVDDPTARDIEVSKKFWEQHALTRDSA